MEEHPVDPVDNNQPSDQKIPGIPGKEDLRHSVPVSRIYGKPANIPAYYPLPPLLQKKRLPYPSVGAAFGLLGIVIAVNAIGSLVLSQLGQIFPKIAEPAYLVVYLIAYVVTWRLGLVFRRDNHIAFKAGPWYLWPVLILFTLIFLFVREPILSLMQGPFINHKDTLSGMELIDPYMMVIIVFAAPLFEEMVFRGIILDGFLKRQPPWRAILMSALLFGIAHINFLQFLNGFLLGLVLGWIYWKTSSLWLCILIHFINNLAATALLYFYDPFRSAIVQMAGSTRMFAFFYAIALAALILLSVLLYYTYHEKELDEEDNSFTEALQNEESGNTL